MALSRHLRVERQVPSFYLMVTGAMVIGIFLIAVWLLSPAAEVTLGGADVVINELTTRPKEKQSGTSEREPIDAKSLEEESGTSSKQEFVTTGRITEDADENNGESDKEGREKVHDVRQKESAEEDKLDIKEKVHLEEKQEKSQSGHKLDDDKFPAGTTAAQAELTAENREATKNWSTQASESTEEKELVKISSGGIENSTKEEGQDREQLGQKDGLVKSDLGSLEQDVNKYPDKGLEKSKDEPSEKGEFVEDEDFQDQAKDKHKEKEIIEPSSSKQKGISEKALIADGGQPTSGEKQKVEESKAYSWNICKWDGAADYIPCLDNKKAIRKLPSIRRFQHRERHCPAKGYSQCLVPLPKGYTQPIRWPRSRDEIWLNNVPHTKLVTYKKDQNWVKIEGEKLIFPGGGTQFKHGASQYVNSIEQSVPDIAWGRHTRVVLDVGCGVASFGGYLFEKDVLTMSFAPKDEHEAQVQLALERGIPAFLSVMGTQRLVFPSNVYDMVHCARCRVHWHGDGGKLLMEVNRVLRPGGYFVWSATPVYQGKPEDDDFWNAVQTVTRSLCWRLVIKTMIPGTGVGFAIYQKPKSNVCYEEQSDSRTIFCDEKDKPDAAWYVPMENCIYKIAVERGSHEVEWPANWPERLDSTPKWLTSSEKSLFGKPAGEEFQMDTEHWRHIIDKSYLTGIGIDWSSIRNVMDTNARYGGFGAALTRQPLWVMNVVPLDEPDTLPVIFDRGLIGVYHDWCESFSTYPRTYDLLHVDHLFKQLIARCDPVVTVLEMDRILRPEGWVILRDKSDILDQIVPIIKSLHWTVHLTYVDSGEELLVAQKGMWRPEEL